MTTPSDQAASDFENLWNGIMMISYAHSFPEFLLKLTKYNKLDRGKKNLKCLCMKIKRDSHEFDIAYKYYSYEID